MNKTINKNDLINYLRIRYGISKNDVTAIVNDLFSFMKNELIIGNEIKIVSFGKFYLRKNTRQEVKLNEKNYAIKVNQTLNFSPSKKFNTTFRKEVKNGTKK